MNNNIDFLHNFYYFFCVSIGVTDCWLNWGSVVRHFYGSLYFYNPKFDTEEYHPFHILVVSPWPVLVAISLLILVNGIINMFTVSFLWGLSLLFGFGMLIWTVYLWWFDVVRESLVQHTKEIKIGIGIGMVLFIVSEVMFFFSFFWAFFHFSLAPGIELGCLWPPIGLEELVIPPFGVPLFNTVVLVVSGITVTCVHHAFLSYSHLQQRMFNSLTVVGERLFLRAVVQLLKVCGQMRFSICEWRLLRQGGLYVGERLVSLIDELSDKLFVTIFERVLGSGGIWGHVVVYFLFTLGLAILFTVSQGMEYVSSAVTISDGVYGSTFFMMTGFHGFHVLVGTVFLLVCFGRIMRQRVSFVRTVGLECAIWYWHFVDVVWLFLFVFVYVWGNGFISTVSLETVASADFSVAWQCGFQDCGSVAMEAIVDLHNYIMFFLCVILGLVLWLLVTLISSEKLRQFCIYTPMFKLREQRVVESQNTSWRGKFRG